MPKHDTPRNCTAGTLLKKDRKMPVTRQIIGTGITQRLSTTISFENYGEEECAELSRWAENSQKNTLKNYLVSWERFCQRLLAKAQLPPWRTRVHIDPEGNWTEIISDDQIKGLQSGRLTSGPSFLVESRYGIDSESWFACEILAAIDRVREAIASGDPASAACAGVQFGDVTRLAVSKFTWEADVLRSKKHLKGSSKGGKARTEAKQKEKERAAWQPEANKIVNKHPKMPWTRVCEQVAATFKKSRHTVRKAIRDPRKESLSQHA
jgi:hypothetical protein